MQIIWKRERGNRGQPVTPRLLVSHPRDEFSRCRSFDSLRSLRMTVARVAHLTIEFLYGIVRYRSIHGRLSYRAGW
jgi:hypothetical protein